MGRKRDIKIMLMSAIAGNSYHNSEVFLISIFDRYVVKGNIRLSNLI